IKCESRRVQLLLYRQIQLLFCDQDFDIAAPERRQNRGVNQRLRERAAGEAKYFGFTFTRAVPALDSARCAHFHIWPDNRTKDEPATRGLFQIRFRLLNRRIFFQGRVQNCVERDRRRGRKDRHRQNRGGKSEFHRWLSFAGGCATSNACFSWRFFKRSDAKLSSSGELPQARE